MRLARWPAVLGLLVSSCWACADIAGFDGNPQMDPGQDCLTCHSAAGSASSLGFSVAGTVYPAALAGAEGGLFNAEVDILDFNGRQLALHTNGAGNFYSAEAIAFPATVSVRVGAQRLVMQKQAPTGQCNACHAVLANADGTLRPSPIPAFLGDAGFAQPAPGRLYGYAGSECAEPPPASCMLPAPSFAEQVEPIIQSNCLACHSPQHPNKALLDNYADIAALGISNNVQVGGCLMPPLDDGGWFPMSPDERELLMDWVACGDPNN